MKDSQRLKQEYNTLRSMILIRIDEHLHKNNDELNLDDDQGNLIVNQIDDQESEVIHRIYRKRINPKTTRIMAGVGIYEEDYELPIGNFDIELLFNILDAAEIASEDLDRDKKLNELDQANQN